MNIWRFVGQKNGGKTSWDKRTGAKLRGRKERGQNFVGQENGGKTLWDKKTRAKLRGTKLRGMHFWGKEGGKNLTRGFFWNQERGIRRKGRGFVGHQNGWRDFLAQRKGKKEKKFSWKWTRFPCVKPVDAHGFHRETREHDFTLTGFTVKPVISNFFSKIAP